MYRMIFITLVLAGGLLGCDDCDEPAPAPLAEHITADIQACQVALDEFASCGPTPDCLPSLDPADSPFSLRVVFNCAASACAGLDGTDADQCRFDAMLNPGPVCADARDLCRIGDDTSTWLALQ